MSPMNPFFKFVCSPRFVANLEKLAERNPDLAAFLNFADEFLTKYTAVDDISGQKISEILEDLRCGAMPEQKQPAHFASVAVEEPRVPETVFVSEQKTESFLGDKSEPVQDFRGSAPAAGGWDSGTQDGLKMSDLDVEQLEKRLLLKIEASRWALERDKLIKAKADFQALIEPRDHALLAKARELTNCYLWMNNPETAPIVATQNYELLSDAYAAAAQCVGFLRRVTVLVDKMPEHEILVRILRDGLYTTATAQSVLRRITSEISGRDDQDQIRLHRWLTQLTKKYRIFVNRHMKKDSLASINRVYDIPDVIKRLDEQLEKVLQKQKNLSEGFRRIKFHTAKILEKPAAEYDWERVFATVEELMALGVRATDPRFAELLADSLPRMGTVPAVKDYPHLNHLLLELNHWGDNAMAAQVRQELQAMHYFTNHSHTHLLDEYTNIVWESDQQEVFTDSPGGEFRAGGGGFQARKNASVVDFVSNSLRDAMSSALSGFETEKSADISPGKAVFGSGIFSRSAAEPSSVGGASAAAEEIEAMTRGSRDFLKNRAILVVDAAEDPAFFVLLEKTFGTDVMFVKADEIRSPESLALRVLPERVGIVLLMKGALPPDNKSAEDYCRQHDKPLLRLESGVGTGQLVRQMSAALSLYK